MNNNDKQDNTVQKNRLSLSLSLCRASMVTMVSSVSLAKLVTVEKSAGWDCRAIWEPSDQRYCKRDGNCVVEYGGRVFIRV